MTEHHAEIRSVEWAKKVYPKHDDCKFCEKNLEYARENGCRVILNEDSHVIGVDAQIVEGDS